MAALIIRKLPDDVRATLRRTAASRHVSVEALARLALTAARAAAGLRADGPAWTQTMDDPAPSRDVLGLS